MSVLDGIENTNRTPEPNISDINSYYPEGFTAPVNTNQGSPFTKGMDLTGEVTSPGALNPQDYDPNAFSSQGNIHKGSYSGSIVGNIPIFVDSHMISLAPYHARERALQEAAAKKSKEIKTLTDELYKVPQLKNAPDQPEMNNIYLSGIEKWKQMYNGDTKSMMNDPKFRAWQNDVQTAGRINDSAFDNYAHMMKEMETGKRFYSQKSREDMKQFLAGAASLGDPTDPNAQNFTSKAFRLNSSVELDDKVNEFLQHYKPESTVSDPEKYKDMGIYDILKQTKITNGDREAIKAAAKNVYEREYKGTGTYTEEEVINRFLEALPVQKDIDIKTPTNQFAPRESKGVPENYSYDNKEDVKNIGTVSRKGQGETSFEISNVYKTNATDQAKQINFPIAQGLKYTDGSPVDTKNGYVKGVVSEIGTAKVYKPGVKLHVKKPGKVVNGVQTYDYVLQDVGGRAVGSIDISPDEVDNPSVYNIQPVAMFNVTENQSGVSGKNAPNKTIIAPLKEVIGYYAKAGKKQGELDLTDMAKDVEKNAKIQDNERLQKVIEYAATLKGSKKTSTPEKKSVTSGKKEASAGKMKPIGDL